MKSHQLKIYNTLSREKEEFQAINPPFVGMYVCGPTVYGDAHLGHARPAVTFDTVNRYLSYLDYRVRYVRNITDVGHLQGDADEGEDKIAKKAKLEQLEPMEVAQQYTDSYHRDMAALNTWKPSIEPRATGHIPEQIALVEAILAEGLAYEVNGSVYFDVLKYNESYKYGKLSGRILDELMSGSRDLDGQGEKRNPVDFALWKNAAPEHLMKWDSPWGIGFPGWHLECTAMSSKYLGTQFDIHGGGMDLMFPHHECEIAQGNACNHQDPARYWMHNNMITINGQKMGKSLGNFITLQELFTGDHKLLEQAYSPMTIRYFMLTAHYRSTLDFSNEALQAAQKGYKKLINGLRIARSLEFSPESGADLDEKQIQQIESSIAAAFRAMDDDFNTAQAIGHLFNLLKKINSIFTGQLKYSSLGEEIFNKLKDTFITFVVDILGLLEEKSEVQEPMLSLLLKLYSEAKTARDYDKVDEIRAGLKSMGFVVKDMKEKIDWAYEE
ncbi:cysteine--tRNA ligase [Algoriphagus zhangzhouensis]|uniref:Cysteine--tRNA ligase n=1 Tax=Algoriphagus zhangzhouensis TaxID=1073327 RepID=A0A1M7ZEL5_9BACT|nr:cysteine--tRNA ligase [Algoriphagus zhangzhouensis]TDY46021.1 cysteinyl-tRNA synthetase [Algoriphagus zhangzhouensis]SHO63249.1 cysteinyl-tRNA synthetase [Algoriphagus zhangzhouensis]